MSKTAMFNKQPSKEFILKQHQRFQ